MILPAWSTTATASVAQEKWGDSLIMKVKLTPEMVDAIAKGTAEEETATEAAKSNMIASIEASRVWNEFVSPLDHSLLNGTGFILTFSLMAIYMINHFRKRTCFRF